MCMYVKNNIHNAFNHNSVCCRHEVKDSARNFLCHLTRHFMDQEDSCVSCSLRQDISTGISELIGNDCYVKWFSVWTELVSLYLQTILSILRRHPH